MQNIEWIADLDLRAGSDMGKDIEANKLFDSSFRTIIEVRLQNNGVLSKHKAPEPITVLCLSGTGVFRAGSDLEDSQDLRGGTLITLEGGIEHEVTADPSLHFIVTKFKDR